MQLNALSCSNLEQNASIGKPHSETFEFYWQITRNAFKHDNTDKREK